MHLTAFCLPLVALLLATFTSAFSPDSLNLATATAAADALGEPRLTYWVNTLAKLVPLEDFPIVIYGVLDTLGENKHMYTGEINGVKLDVVSISEARLNFIQEEIKLDHEKNCFYYSTNVNADHLFKNAYDVAERLDSVAPTEEIFDRVLALEKLDRDIATACSLPPTFGNSMSYFLKAVPADQLTDAMKTTASATPVSGSTVRAIQAASLYYVGSRDFNALPTKYLAATELDLTYIFDAFTALAEVVGPSQKAISDYFTSPVLAGTTTHIIEALVDKEGETVQLEFAVKLMKDLYVDPCSYENPTYASDAVKKVADDLCACTKVVNFTDTSSTCDDVPAGSFYYFPADAVRPIARLCPAGTKQPEINQTECLPCESNEICEVPGVVTPDKKPSTLSGGAITGIAIGSVVVVAAIAGGAFFLVAKKKKDLLIPRYCNGHVSTQP